MHKNGKLELNSNRIIPELWSCFYKLVKKQAMLLNKNVILGGVHKRRPQVEGKGVNECATLGGGDV